MQFICRGIVCRRIIIRCICKRMRTCIWANALHDKSVHVLKMLNRLVLSDVQRYGGRFFGQLNGLFRAFARALSLRIAENFAYISRATSYPARTQRRMSTNITYILCAMRTRRIDRRARAHSLTSQSDYERARASHVDVTTTTSTMHKIHSIRIHIRQSPTTSPPSFSAHCRAVVLLSPSLRRIRTSSHVAHRRCRRRRCFLLVDEAAQTFPAQYFCRRGKTNAGAALLRKANSCAHAPKGLCQEFFGGGQCARAPYPAYNVWPHAIVSR